MSVEPNRRDQKVDTRTHHTSPLPEQTAVARVETGTGNLSNLPTEDAIAIATGTRAAVAKSPAATAAVARPPSGLLGAWTRATLALAGAGSVLALGTRTLFERTIGAVPYDMPSTGVTLGAIALSSALGAAFVAWSSETANDSAPIKPPGKGRPARIVSQTVLGAVLVGLLQGAHERADDPTDLKAPNASLAEVEHRALLRPEHAASQLALGETYFQAGRYADARAPLEKVRMLTSAPDDFRTVDYVDRTWQERVVPATKMYTRAKVL